MSPLAEALIGAVLRHALAAIGAYIVAQHWLTDSQAQDAQEHLVGYLLTHAELYGPIALALGWSVVEKYKARLLTIAASELPPGSSDAQIARKASDPIVKSMVTHTMAVLVAVALCGGLLTGCASAPPTGTYDAPTLKAYNAGQLLNDLQALSDTAINLNRATGQAHLKDHATVLIRDGVLVVAAGVNAYGNGATTLGAFQASLDATPLTGVSAAVRAAVDRAIVDHGVGASVLVVAVDAFATFDQNPAVQAEALTHPTLAAALGAVRGGINSIPVQ